MGWGGLGGSQGVSGDVGASLQCFAIKSNNLLRNVGSQHSDAEVLSIISADPSSHTPSPACVDSECSNGCIFHHSSTILLNILI